MTKSASTKKSTKSPAKAAEGITTTTSAKVKADGTTRKTTKVEAKHVDKQAARPLDDLNKHFTNALLLFKHESKEKNPDISSADIKKKYAALGEDERLALKQRATEGRERFHTKRGNRAESDVVQKSTTNAHKKHKPHENDEIANAQPEDEEEEDVYEGSGAEM